MPIYAYRCDACGFQKDVLQKLSEPALTQCPSCEAESFVKQLSAPAFQLKGTGWYVTDFRDNGKKADGKADARDGAESTASGGDGADKPTPAKSGAAAGGSESTSSTPSAAAPATSKAGTAASASAGAA